MIKSIVLNGKSVKYNLIRKNVKNINFRIKPDGSIFVSANRFLPQYVIDEALLKKSDFIINSLKKYSASNKAEIKYISGSEITLFGKEYELRLIKGEGVSCIKDKALTVFVNDTQNIEEVKHNTDSFIKDLLMEKLKIFSNEMYSFFCSRGVTFPIIKIRYLKSLWGSCRPKKRVLTFNFALYAAPDECIRYVVAHEFTHFLVQNHSKEFYKELSAIVPDYKECRKRLNKITIK